MNTSQLLNEWKSFLLLNEHKVFSLDEIIETILQVGRDEKEAEYLRTYWNSNRFITKYSQVIQNELKNTQEPIREILDVCALHYEKIYQSAGPKLKDQIGSGNINTDALRKQIDAKSGFNKNEVRQQCQYRNGRPVVGSYQDFDVVYSEADYIVIEPKTIQGSIAWAHGKPDGLEETDQKRRVGWCTGVSSANNMFPNYAGNLHMFYIINADYDNDNSANRRLCLSFRIENDEPILNEGNGSTVNALNRKIKDIENIKSQKFYQDILKALQGRKQTSFAEIYSKITVSQLKRTIAQMKSQNIDDAIMQAEIKNYIKYASSDDVLLFLLKDVKYQMAIADKVCYNPEEFDSTFKKILEIDRLLPLVAKTTSDQNVIKFLVSKNSDSVDYELVHNESVDNSIKNELAKNILGNHESFNSQTPVIDLIEFVKFLEKSRDKARESNGLYRHVQYDSLENIYYLLFKENDFNEVIANTQIEFISPEQKKTFYYNSIVSIKEIYVELFSQNFDFWLDILTDNFYKNITHHNLHLSKILAGIELSDSQLNKIINILKQSEMSYWASLDLITYLYNCNLSKAQKKIIESKISSSREEFSRDVMLGVFRKIEDEEDLSSEDRTKNKVEICLDLFNISNESQKSFLAIEAQEHLGENCPELIKNSVPMFLKLLTSKYLNKSFEEYSKLFQECNFDSFVKEYNDPEGDFEGLFYEKYTEFLDDFLSCNIVKENPEGVYNLFKSIGIDFSDDHSIFNVWFFDIMAIGYTSLNDMFKDLDYLIPIFGRNIDLNESLLKRYISLVLS